VQTFGRDYLYVFGEKPRALTFQATLMNTLDMNWRGQFWENWDNRFRAERLIEQDARMYIGWDDILVEGYPISAVSDEVSDAPNAIRMSMTFYVTNYTNLSARSGFRAQAAQTIPTIAGGFRTGTPELKATRTSFIELLNFYEDVQDPLLARTLARASRGAFAVAQGEANAAAFLRAFTFRTIQDTTSQAVNAAIREAEDTGFGGLTSRLKRGEINAWFGYLASVVNTLDRSSWDGFSGFAGDGLVGELFVAGSVQRIIDTLSYNAAGLITAGLPAPKAGGVVSTSVRPFRDAGGLGTQTAFR
jgi:hypothetical protein